MGPPQLEVFPMSGTIHTQTSTANSTGHSGIHPSGRKKLILATVLCLVLAVILVAINHSFKLQETYSVTVNASELILVSLAVHLIDRTLMEQDHTRELRAANDKIIEKLVEQSASLNALSKSGVVRIFSERNELIDVFREYLLNPESKDVLVMGISLNDFLLHDIHESLYGAFRNFIRRDGTRARLLLIDPTSQAALLREKAEHRFIPPFEARYRLEDEVPDGIRVLDGYMATTGSKDGDPLARLLYRVYHTAPTYFMFVTPTDCYVQPYHFWLQRGRSKALPVLHYRALPGIVHDDLIKMVGSDTELASKPDSVPSMFEEMVGHFAWMWGHAATTSQDFADGVENIERNARRGSIRTLFPSEPSQQIKRMTALMKEAEECIWLLGISLKSYADPDLMHIILEAAQPKPGGHKGAEIRLLVIDPSCREAQYRASREQQIIQDRMGSSGEEPGDGYEDSEMFRDTFAFVEAALRNLGNGTVKMYKNFPSCFLCRIDNHVFVEQYHLGEGAQNKLHVLGKNMPLIELSREEEEAINGMPLLNEESERMTHRDPKERPFEVLVSHFEYQWNRADDILLSKINEKKEACRRTIKIAREQGQKESAVRE